MSSYRLVFKQFFKNKFLSIFTLTFFSVLFIKIFYSITVCVQTNSEPLDYLRQTLSIAIYSFIYFLFISNDFFYNTHKENILEILRSTKRGMVVYYFSAFSSLFTIAFIYNVIVSVINIIIYYYLQVNHVEYFFHILFNVFLNIFIPCIIGILLGGILSFIKKHFISYLIIVAIVFVSSPVFELVSESVYLAGINIYNLYDFFNIFPPLLDWSSLYSFGFSLLTYRKSIIFFWLFFALFILLLIFAKKTNKKNIAPSLICVFVCIGCLVGYFHPASKVTMSNSPVDGALADVNYYENNEIIENKADFNIKKYILDIRINSQLEVCARITLEPNNSNTYDFTLYHGYKIENVTDTDGTPLLFTQSGDYFTVSGSDSILDEIIVYYAGSAVKFFSNEQATFLPGWFAYYPHPGRQAIFSSSHQSFLRTLCDSDTEFQVYIKSPQNIYCNLEKRNDAYYGHSNGLTLISGFYDNLNYKGIDIFYPYLATQEFYPENIKLLIDKYLEMGIIEKSQKKIFVIPNTNLVSAYERYCGFKDHITLYQLNGLPTIYEMQNVPANKLSLYTAFSVYKSDKHSFDEVVNFKRQWYHDSGDSSNEDVYILLDEKLKELGHEKVAHCVEQYLSDDTIVTNEIEFLKEIS